MFDIGWTELLLIGIVALIVVGPKDLPVMFHTLGRFTAKARSMAREFTRAMDDAAKESGVSDVAKDLKDMTSARKLGLDKVQEAASKFEKWDPMKKTTSPRGPATTALTEERAAAAEKVREATAKRASERIAAEEAAKVADAKPAVAAKPAAVTKTKPAAKPKPAAKAKPEAKAKPAAKPKAAKTTKAKSTGKAAE